MVSIVDDVEHIHERIGRMGAYYVKGPDGLMRYCDGHGKVSRVRARRNDDGNFEMFLEEIDEVGIPLEPLDYSI